MHDWLAAEAAGSDGATGPRVSSSMLPKHNSLLTPMHAYLLVCMPALTPLTAQVHILSCMPPHCCSTATDRSMPPVESVLQHCVLVIYSCFLACLLAVACLLAHLHQDSCMSRDGHACLHYCAACQAANCNSSFRLPLPRLSGYTLAATIVACSKHL